MNRDQLKKSIRQYVADLETELTEDTCLCEWNEVETAFGMRKVQGARFGGTVNLDCPVHTREGLILAYVEKYIPSALTE